MKICSERIVRGKSSEQSLRTKEQAWRSYAGGPAGCAVVRWRGVQGAEGEEGLV